MFLCSAFSCIKNYVNKVARIVVKSNRMFFLITRSVGAIITSSNWILSLLDEDENGISGELHLLVLVSRWGQALRDDCCQWLFSAACQSTEKAGSLASVDAFNRASISLIGIAACALLLQQYPDIWCDSSAVKHSASSFFSPVLRSKARAARVRRRQPPRSYPATRVVSPSRLILFSSTSVPSRTPTPRRIPSGFQQCSATSPT